MGEVYPEPARCEKKRPGAHEATSKGARTLLDADGKPAGLRAQGGVRYEQVVVVLVFALFEVLAGFIYASSRNLLAISLIDAGWLALVIAAIFPIRI